MQKSTRTRKIVRYLLIAVSVLAFIFYFGFAFIGFSDSKWFTSKIDNTLFFPIYNQNSRLVEDTSYPSLKQAILKTRSRTNRHYISEDSLSRLFTKLLVDKIIPHWLTTPWSFIGHTSIPRQGEIACGYFVSTTLRDVGVNLNRYKFAQQLPINEAKTISLGKPLLEIYNTNPASRIQALKDTLSEGIYFIGFDQSHVGYILKKDDELFVITFVVL